MGTTYYPDCPCCQSSSSSSSGTGGDPSSSSSGGGGSSSSASDCIRLCSCCFSPRTKVQVTVSGSYDASLNDPMYSPPVGNSDYDTVVAALSGASGTSASGPTVTYFSGGFSLSWSSCTFVLSPETSNETCVNAVMYSNNCQVLGSAAYHVVGSDFPLGVIYPDPREGIDTIPTVGPPNCSSWTYTGRLRFSSPLDLWNEAWSGSITVSVTENDCCPDAENTTCIPCDGEGGDSSSSTTGGGSSSSMGGLSSSSSGV